MGAAGLDPYAASTLLGAFAAETAGAAAGPGRGSRPDSSEWAPVATEAIEFPGPTATLMGAWAPAVRPKGAVLVIHENRGLTDHIRQVAGRFAATGFSALAIDLLSEEGGAASFPGEAEVMAALAAIPPERFDADMKAGVTELPARTAHSPKTRSGFESM